jgi:hypothetical protein
MAAQLVYTAAGDATASSRAKGAHRAWGHREALVGRRPAREEWPGPQPLAALYLTPGIA